MYTDFNKYERRHLHAMRRRLWYLDEKIALKMDSVHFDKAEASALRWAIQRIAPDFKLDKENPSAQDQEPR